MKYIRTLFNILRSFSSPHPLRDWLLLLLVSILLLMTLFAVSVYFFIGTQSGTFVNATLGGVVSVPRLPRAELEKLVTVLEERRLNYENNELSLPAFPDPSR